MRRANLAVVAHIRHVYTNYDELLRSGIPWIDARRGVEQFTLDKLVSWRSDEDDDDDPNIDAMLREVVVISDDEQGDISSDRPFDSQIGHVNAAPIQSAAKLIDLTETDDEDESEDEGLAAYAYSTSSKAGNTKLYNPAREARQGQERHARWEEAIHRQKRGPDAASSTKVIEDANVSQQGQLNISVQDPIPRPIPGLDSYNESIARMEVSSPSPPEIRLRDGGGLFKSPVSACASTKDYV